MPAPRQHDDPSPELLVDVCLESEPSAPGRARHALDDVEDRFDPDMLHSLRLLVSELVTNAVRHAGLDEGDEITLRVVVQGDSVLVEVRDPGDGFAQLPTEPRSVELEPPDDWVGGWGLGIVDALSDRWGVDRNGGTRVWSEVRCRGA